MIDLSPEEFEALARYASLIVMGAVGLMIVLMLVCDWLKTRKEKRDSE